MEHIWLYTALNGRSNIWCDRCQQWINTINADEGYPSERKNFAKVLKKAKRHIRKRHR